MARGRDGSTWVMQGAVIASILVHASFIAAAGLRREKPTEPIPEEPPAAVDHWAGNTAMAVGGELHEVDLAGSDIGGAPTPAMPASPASPPANAPTDAPAEPPKVAEKTPPEETKPSAPVEKAPPEEKKPSAPVEKAPPEEKKPSETAEEPPRKEPKVSSTTEKPPRKERNVSSTTEKPPRKERKPSKTAEETTETDEEPSPSAEKPSKASKATPKVASGEKNGDESGGSGGSFGAEGPASVRDLGDAFTRALPIACQADPVWGKLDVGKAGAIEVAIIISEEGKITGFEPITQNPPSHLVNTMKRTVALLRGGIFGLRGRAVTAGRQILRLSTELSDTPVATEDASGAGAISLAHNWAGKRGVASFTQASGRHVEVTIEFLRVEITSGG